jgi:hypothetical protein
LAHPPVGAKGAENRLGERPVFILSPRLAIASCLKGQKSLPSRVDEPICDIILSVFPFQLNFFDEFRRVLFI